MSFKIRVLERVATFLTQTRQKADVSSRRIGILGAPFSKGQKKDGVDKGPDALRKHGMVDQLQELGLDVKDYGNLNFEYPKEDTQETKIKNPSAVAAASKKVSTAVKDILLDERHCVTIGGDHSLGMGTVHGHAQVNDICVLWIDAHSDINTTETSTSGNFHGMPCSFLVKEVRERNKHLPAFDWLDPPLKKSNLAYIGLRDVDKLEQKILDEENILHFNMRHIDKLGIFEVLHRALEAINPSGKLSLHVSFDIDSIDKMVTRSTGTPVHGGLTVRDALDIAEEVSSLDSFKALDMVEVNPTLGSKEQAEETMTVALMVLKAFFGHLR